MVADAHSKLSMGSLAHVEEEKKGLTKDIHCLANLGVRLLDSEDGGVAVQNMSKSSLVSEVKEKKNNDPILLQLKEEVLQQKIMAFEQGEDGVLRYQGRLCVLDVYGLRERIMAEAHYSSYSIHLRSPKMYYDLREIYWWNNMKRNIADFVLKCPNCQQFKVEHQKPSGFAQDIAFPVWKWDMINMDFVSGL